eukprot:TRINITY_DN61765_c0_g1_i1.p2 TRINITY_DN61765_c0_g1~~TRINITY_DN61765_c0_g1_i1.p2  ORF type:complete len:296 (+),score=43.32 TRINITY_DN61765_c0_g1_i1:234-1121(+)
MAEMEFTAVERPSAFVMAKARGALSLVAKSGMEPEDELLAFCSRFRLHAGVQAQLQLLPVREAVALARMLKPALCNAKDPNACVVAALARQSGTRVTSDRGGQDPRTRQAGSLRLCPQRPEPKVVFRNEQTKAEFLRTRVVADTADRAESPTSAQSAAAGHAGDGCAAAVTSPLRTLTYGIPPHVRSDAAADAGAFGAPGEPWVDVQTDQRGKAPACVSRSPVGAGSRVDSDSSAPPERAAQCIDPQTEVRCLRRAVERLRARNEMLEARNKEMEVQLRAKTATCRCGNVVCWAH